MIEAIWILIVVDGDLGPTSGGNIIAGLLKPQLDHTSRVLSIARNDVWINSNCGQCLERIEGALPGPALGNLRYSLHRPFE